MPYYPIPSSGGGGGFMPVTVTADWATADNAWADIKTSTGMAGIESTYYQIYFTLWEGSADSDDYAQLKIMYDGEVFVVSYSQFEDYGFSDPAFSSAPSSGTAYIIGVQVYTYIVPG